MGTYRTEAVVLIALGAVLTAIASAGVFDGQYGRTVVTGLGAIVSFLLALLVTWSDRRRAPRPGDGREHE